MEFIPDLTKRPPRSPSVRLGGYSTLPRCLDKGRSTIAGTNGEYQYGSWIDTHLFQFIGIDSSTFLEALAQGKGDWEMLQWLASTSPAKRLSWEIAAWSAHMENQAPQTLEARSFYHKTHKKIAAMRTDLAMCFDLMDADDYLSFGGHP